MNERTLASKYLNKFKLENKSSLVVRIPDSPVGRKPFDAFIFMDSMFMAIEFKLVGEKLLDHQSFSLEQVKRNGGIAKVIYFYPKGKVKETIL